MSAATKYCHACAATIDVRAEICPKCGVRQPGAVAAGGYDPGLQEASTKKVAAGVCGILFGAFGIHKFILGLTTPGLVMLAVTLLTCGIGAFPMGILGLIEGIIYLTKSDADFYETYVVGQKGWL